MGKLKEFALCNEELETYGLNEWSEIIGYNEPEDVLNDEEYCAWLKWRDDEIYTYLEGDL